MQNFEVKVIGRSIAYYEVRASSAAEAEAKWRDGDLLSVETDEEVVESVAETWEDDGIDWDNPYDLVEGEDY